jgi:hypothetical protein
MGKARAAFRLLPDDFNYAYLASKRFITRPNPGMPG